MFDKTVQWNRTGRFQYDATGNWLRYDKYGISETRTHNAANEIASLEYDRNGNTISLQNANCRYDAWNRLVEVNENIAYRYDGLNRRIEKAVDGIVTKSFFNRNWQEVENASDGETTICVLGMRYMDDLICRDKNGERLYSLQDANWNVVAITNHDGVVQERFCYDAFGRIEGLASDWNRTFTGQVYDHETGLMLYRNRFYSTELGRFLQRDPIGYDAGDQNVYRYVGNRAVNEIDPMGLHVLPPIFGNPNDYVDQVYQQPAPTPPPTPTGEGCPDGWKMVQQSPPVPNGCGPAGGGIKAALAGVGVAIGHWVGESLL